MPDSRYLPADRDSRTIGPDQEPIVFHFTSDDRLCELTDHRQLEGYSQAVKK
jgi:hypothetical protein